MTDYAWEHRFDEAENTLGVPAADALRRLFDFYGKDLYSWLASLYDPDSGMFYYAPSARDSEDFLPDCESTAQALNLLTQVGMFDCRGRSWKDAMPPETAPRCLAWTQSMQSPEDGYFYNPQWGRNVGSSRLGRDLSQSLALIRHMGGKPLYPTALERLAAAPRENTAAPDWIPAYLTSEEAMRAYLDRLDVHHDSHSAGHILSSQTSQIESAGLADFVCAYLDERQNPETGLWEDEANYRSLSGVIKIGALYHGLGRQIRFGYTIVDTAINVILSSEEPDNICLVFNPLGSLSTALGSVAGANAAARGAGQPEPYDMNLIRQKIAARLPEIIDVTIEKLRAFRHPDGSYSYFPGRSSPYTQGTLVSLGLREGDVNGTAVAVHYILNAIFGFLGISPIPLCSEEDYRRFYDEISRAVPPAKSPVPREFLDFSGGCMTYRQKSEGNFFFDLHPNPADSAKKALYCRSEKGGHASLSYDCREFLHPLPAVKHAEMEAKLYICPETEDGAILRILLGSADRSFPCLTLEKSGTSLLLRQPDSDETAAVGAVGTWLPLRTVCTAEAGSTHVTVLLSGSPLFSFRSAEREAPYRLILNVPEDSSLALLVTDLAGTLA